MMKLNSNADLSAYLTLISSRCENLGLGDVAYTVRHAAKYASGSSSEFLHEAQKALKVVVVQGQKHLSTVEKEEVNSVIEQIEMAFAKIGGA